MGCFFLIRRGLWEALGGFDLSFVTYGEETDLCRRARDRGLARPRLTPGGDDHPLRRRLGPEGLRRHPEAQGARHAGAALPAGLAAAARALDDPDLAPDPQARAAG